MPDASCHVTKSVGHECPSYGGKNVRWVARALLARPALPLRCRLVVSVCEPQRRADASRMRETVWVRWRLPQPTV